MEQLYAVLTGVVSQLLTFVAIKFWNLEGGERATITTLISFLSIVVALSVMEAFGYHYEPSSPQVMEFGGLAFSTNQVAYMLSKYVLPRVSNLFLNLHSGPSERL